MRCLLCILLTFQIHPLVLKMTKFIFVKKAPPFKLPAQLASSGLIPWGARWKASLRPLGRRERGGRRWFWLFRDQNIRHHALLLILRHVPRFLLQLLGLALPWDLDQRGFDKWDLSKLVRSPQARARIEELQWELQQMTRSLEPKPTPRTRGSSEMKWIRVLKTFLVML